MQMGNSKNDSYFKKVEIIEKADECTYKTLI